MPEFCENPTLVKSPNGFSVFYKDRFLYSKYDPKKAIFRTINSLSILDGTLFLCFSPTLGYGVLELAQKCPKNCAIFLIEADNALFEFSKPFLEKIATQKNIFLIFPHEIPFLCDAISNPKKKILCKKTIPHPGTFKRVISLSMSAGTFFSQKIFCALSQNLQEVICAFWKNRATLVKLGRLFSKNFFSNLAFATTKKVFFAETFFSTIQKPILIVGAGPSAQKILYLLKNQILSGDFFVLAVDASLSILKTLNINANGVVALESQAAIEKCYVGSLPHNTIFFADLTSRPSVIKKMAKNNTIAFFWTEFSRTNFFIRAQKKGILPQKFPPLGSVALSAVFLAQKLRATCDIPIFVCGLDFSFCAGQTHSRGTIFENERYFSSNRISFPLAFFSAFSSNAEKFFTKNLKMVFSSKALISYAKNFHATFCKTKNLFDLNENALDLKIPQKILQKNPLKISSKKIENLLPKKIVIAPQNKIRAYIIEEKKSLCELRSLLSSGKSENFLPQTKINFQKIVKKLLANREYLFLHFPDGFNCDFKSISFLKRARTEIDWFLKVMKF